MIGATAAYCLRKEGLSVALLDKRPAGREASWASAGMIQPYGPKDDASWSARAVRLSRELYDDLEPRLFEETGQRIGYGMMQGPATAAAVTDLVFKRKPRLALDAVDPERLLR